MKLHFHFLVKTYNFSSYIADYLESLRFQITNFSRDYFVELTVVDDCSDDNTLETLNDWLASHGLIFDKFEVLVNHKNLGISQTQIVALNAIKSDFFHIMDGDDVYNYPNIFEFITNANQFDIYFSPTIRFHYSTYKKSSFIRSLLPYLHFYWSKDKIKILLKYNPLPNPGSRTSKELLIRRLEDANYSDDSMLYLSGGDLVSWLEAFSNKGYAIGYSFLPHVLYRVGSGVSTKKTNTKRSFDLDLSKIGYGQVKYDSPFLLKGLQRIYFKVSQLFVLFVSVVIKAFPCTINQIIIVDKKSRDYLYMLSNFH